MKLGGVTLRFFKMGGFPPPMYLTDQKAHVF
jgi:hypothetical protein